MVLQETARGLGRVPRQPGLCITWLQQALALLQEVRTLWAGWLAGLDTVPAGAGAANVDVRWDGAVQVISYLASGTNAYDQRTGTWSSEVLQAARLDPIEALRHE